MFRFRVTNSKLKNKKSLLRVYGETVYGETVMVPPFWGTELKNIKLHLKLLIIVIRDSFTEMIFTLFSSVTLLNAFITCSTFHELSFKYYLGVA